MSKTTLKKRDVAKNTHLHKSEINDEIKQELEAMTGLEYNLHGSKEIDIIDNSSVSQKKWKAQITPEWNKINEKVTMETDKSAKEKNEVESSIPFVSSSISKKELRKVIEQPGNTTEDRYKILEARDRLMRLRHKKVHTLETAKATVGTCPDMCPEKERLMREFQRQVAPYELLEASEYRISHKIAVKQYSRSSADQEEPMPHDLRPVSSLKMTMSYLLHEIADLCEEEGTNLAEWYHFLWDRTRGIRKDITQQELCCVDTVELVEACARFHIVCSERLRAEEVSVFDEKINTENLTKCLQTLKYMYQDLRDKGINCKNEAEFRAYIILLNLNDANFMWDLQLLPLSIQKSSEVNFSVRVYAAIQSKNYTKFFKLVKNTTYLNACILLRYFFQVRSQALSVMGKAYCRTSSTAYPLYEFIDILAFDDENEAINFCEQSGLSVSNDEMHIILNRHIELPSTSVDQNRAKNIVELKRIRMGYSFGQVIAGNEMPDQLYINHKPHSSFNSQGYLKNEAINANDQSGSNGDIEIDEDQEEQDQYEYMDEDMTDEVAEPDEEAINRSSPNFNTVNNGKETSDVLSTLFTSTSAKKSTSSDGTSFSFASVLDKTKNNKFSQLVEDSSKMLPTKTGNEDCIKSTLSTIEKPILFNESSSKINNIFAQQKSPVSTKNIFKVPFKVNHSNDTKLIISSQPNNTSILPMKSEKTLFSENKDNQNNSFAPKFGIESSVSPKKEVTHMETDEKKVSEEKIENIATEIAKEIETEMIQKACSTILKEQIKNSVTHDELSKKIFTEILEEVIEENCQKILKTEIAINEKIQDMSNRMKNKIVLKYYLIWCQRVLTRKQQRKALDNTPVWLPRYSLIECANSLYNKEQNLVIQNMRSKRKSNNDFEMDQRHYLVPVEVHIYNGIKRNASGLDVELSSIMFWKMVISWPNLKEKFLLGRYKKIMCEYFCPRDFSMDPIIKIYKPNAYETLNICIKHMDEIIDENHSVGADGLFFIATTDEDPKAVANRLSRTVLSRKKLMRMPLVVVILGDEKLHEKMKPTKEIRGLIESGYISECVVHCESRIDESIILRLAQTAITWLTRHKSPQFPLEMNTLSELINSCLTDELWLRISGHSRFNTNLSMALKHPQFVINMHNEAIAHLIDIINDPEYLMYTNFPPEFKYCLPVEIRLPCTYEYFGDDWKSIENRSMIESIIKSFTLPQWPFDWPIEDTIEIQKCIVQYYKSALRTLNHSRLFNNILSNLFYMIDENGAPSFIHVILEISKELLRGINGNMRVVYNKNHIKHFQTLPWWFESDTMTKFNARSRASDHVLDGEPTEKKRRIDTEKIDLSCIIDEYSNYIRKNDSENSFIEQSHFDDVFNISQKFEKTLSIQLSLNNNLEKKLSSALKEVDINTL